MSIRIVIKGLILLVTLVSFSISCMWVWHLTIAPMGGIFERFVPNIRPTFGGGNEVEILHHIASSEIRNVDPGEKIFHQARQMIIMGDAHSAQEKLATIIHLHPNSSTAPNARKILGEMHMDELLSTTSMEGKIPYTVVSGDAYLSIVKRHQTTLENFLHINHLKHFANLQPNDRLVLMPLNFRIIITPGRESLALWNEGSFIREYAIVENQTTGQSSGKLTTIEAKSAMLGNRRLDALSPGYAAAEKTILLANGITIRPFRKEDSGRPRGIYLRQIDLEELNLLVRIGNEVEFR